MSNAVKLRYTDPADLPAITEGQQVSHADHGTVTVTSTTTMPITSPRARKEIEVPVTVTGTTSTGAQVTFPASEVLR